MQIDKMTGRDDEEAGEVQSEERVLDLHVVDYHPGMRRQTDTAIADPVRYPRFGDTGERGVRSLYCRW